MRTAYLSVLALAGAFGVSVALLWSLGIGPALHITGWQQLACNICAGWIGGALGVRLQEHNLEKLERVRSFMRDMQFIARRDEERARA